MGIQGHLGNLVALSATYWLCGVKVGPGRQLWYMARPVFRREKDQSHE